MRSVRASAICRSALWVTFVTNAVLQLQARPISTVTGSALQPWRSEAKLQRLPKSVRGTLTILSDGVEFCPDKGTLSRWSFEEIKTVVIASPRRLSLVTYQNNRWHMPGDRPFEFALATQMPTNVAAELVRRVDKPAINGDPPAAIPNIAVIPARHRTRTGGSNGALRFTDHGIDYLSKASDARSWRWIDIETLSYPEPYRFRVGGHLETFDFELKQPLSNDLFNQLWDHVYAEGLNINKQQGGTDE